MATKASITSGTYKRKTGLGARRAAIKDWRGKAKGLHGASWAHWRKAKDKQRVVWGPYKAVCCYVRAKPHK